MKNKSVCFLLLVLAATSAFAISAPNNLKVIALPGSKVTMSWDSVSDASGYNIYRKVERSDSNFRKINSSPISANSFVDSSAVLGKSHLYYVTAVDAAGTESQISKTGSAPKMSLDVVVSINHPGGAPTPIKSIATGKNVTMAVPGDIIQYKILLANNGYGQAANVVVTYPVPSGTRVIPSSLDPDGLKSSLEFFDSHANKWISVAEIKDDKNISRVRFNILEPIDPKASGYSGYVAFQVLIET